MNTSKIVTFLFVILSYPIVQAHTPEVRDSLAQELQEVVVTARQPATKLVGTSLVSTIAGSDLADLGNALDVLAQLPMIQIEDNTVRIIGKNNVEIYIDNRPLRDTTELQQMLSSNMKKVELIMAPGASYESTTDAILKITTKRSFIQGISVSEQLRIQRRRKWSLMDDLSLCYRTDNWEFFINGTVNRNNSVAKGSTTNSLEYRGEETVVGSSQYNSFPTTTGVVKAGFNYSAHSQSFGAYYRYNPEVGDFNNSGTVWVDNYPPIKRVINKSIKSRSHLASLYYENTFADRCLMHFDGDFRQSTSKNNVTTMYPGSTDQEVNSTDERTSILWAGKLYLNLPLWDGSFTFGTQDSYTRTTLNFHMLNSQVGEYIPSSFTDARQAFASLFASWTRIFGKFSLSAGARYEYVDYDFKVDGKRDENSCRRDHLLTPDLTLGYSFDKEAQMSLSYKIATVKPPYSQLTGSLNYVGLHEIEGGNPALRDERIHDFMLFGMWKSFMFEADFVRSIDAYAYVKQLYPAADLQLLMHPVNIDVSALSMYLVWSHPVRRWTPNLTVGMYRQWLALDNTKHNKPMFSYLFSNTFSFPSGWMITANINGQTQGDMHTNRFGATWINMNVSVGKTFFNKSLTVKLSFTDILNSANNDWTMNTYGIFVDKRQSYDRRGIMLDLIYNFHPHKSKYKGEVASETEMKRL